MMRRSDREVTDFNEILEIMRRCDTCRLAFNDGEYPYILPLNFGMWVDGEKITLIFHSALEGYKVGLIQDGAAAAFEMDTNHLLQYFAERGYCTMSYESVMGRGKIRILPDEDKAAALAAIMDHYHPGDNAYFNPAAMPRTLVYALEVTALTAKRKQPK